VLLTLSLLSLVYGMWGKFQASRDKPVGA